MKTFGDKNWQITLPQGWVGEDDVEFKSIYHPEGVGELLISSYLHDETISNNYLEEFADDHLEAGAEGTGVELGDFDGFTLCYATEDEYLCEWYLKSGKLMLFITYSCPLEDEGTEDDIVEFMLESLSKSG